MQVLFCVQKLIAASLLVLLMTARVHAQTPPAIGYMYPPGGPSGTTTEVVLGGYDWTPDMEVFVHDHRIKLEIIAPAGPVIVPEPPYWFGKKSRRAPFLLPREARARLTIPADVPPGVVRWQAANANGATATGQFMVGSGDEEIEDADRSTAQTLAKLPVTVSGQIRKVEEVDCYQFIATKSGPVSCSLVAQGLGSPLNAAMEVFDSSGTKISSTFDTAGNDTAVTFLAQKDQSFTIKIYDIDFRGNRSFVYRMHLSETPRVVAAIPSAGQRGTTQEVEFIGYGIASGEANLESVTRQVSFPATDSQSSFSYQLETPYGTASDFTLFLSEFPESIETAEAVQKISSPGSATGVLDKKFEEDEYQISGGKGDTWTIRAIAQEIGSPLDVALSVADKDGKELARNDDALNTTDALLHFTVPADGDYQIRVADFSGQSGRRDAVYRLLVQPTQPGFSFIVPERINASLGEKTKLALKVIRNPGFKQPISVSFSNLADGVTVPKDLEIPAGKSALSVEIDIAADAAVTGRLVTINGLAMLNDKETVQQASSPILIATTIKPPYSIDAEGKDDVTKWPRGTTFPAPVLIEREPGFDEVIRLEMAAKQGRHRQGIRGPELDVPAGIERILYPVYLPEWLETTRTSRMVVNGVAKVRDPQGNIRYSLTRQKTRMGFLPTGALLKVSADQEEFEVASGETFSVPITIRRSQQLQEPILVEIVSKDNNFSAQPLTVSSKEQHVQLPVLIKSHNAAYHESDLTIRTTVMQSGKYPVISETTVIITSTNVALTDDRGK
ncbi:hypothetical protein Mal48_23020 [Thalassoglobus polymorphus]|uniref:Subtilase-type serine protease n=2 Tax=Thalassoglobus polymorphus TaxID=2527994 RepID=A0A517QN26_9PLAN|nr:hypothetical protein Mal48_23020 [Thalassoglobus polymorphus]